MTEAFFKQWNVWDMSTASFWKPFHSLSPSLFRNFSTLQYFIRTNKCGSFFGVPEKRSSSRRAGECACKCFLTRWRRIMAKLWKSLRRPASAYAHYLWVHAASWLPFTKAGTQGQREWEWEMCVCVCACIHPQMKYCLSCVYGRFLSA